MDDQYLTDSDDDSYYDYSSSPVEPSDDNKKEKEIKESKSVYTDEEMSQHKELIDHIVNDVVEKWQFPKAIKVHKNQQGESIEYSFKWDSPNWLNNKVGYYVMYIPFSYNCNIIWEFIWNNNSHKNGDFSAKRDDISDVLDKCRDDIVKHHNKKLMQYEELRV